MSRLGCDASWRGLVWLGVEVGVVLEHLGGGGDVPDSTVKTAAKALSLSPSITLLEWKSSRHIRLKPTTKSMMYSTSDTTDSQRTPAERGE